MASIKLIFTLLLIFNYEACLASPLMESVMNDTSIPLQLRAYLAASGDVFDTAFSYLVEEKPLWELVKDAKAKANLRPTAIGFKKKRPRPDQGDQLGYGGEMNKEFAKDFNPPRPGQGDQLGYAGEMSKEFAKDFPPPRPGQGDQLGYAGEMNKEFAKDYPPQYAYP